MLPQKPSFTIISGGQTGVDRTALEWAIDHSILHCGWCPKGRKAEDSVIPDRYNLEETSSRNYITCTKRNVADSDGTLIINLGPLEGGSLQTSAHARILGKPLLIVDLTSGDRETRAMILWIENNSIIQLNVAGPRESKRPGVYGLAHDWLNLLFDSVPGHFRVP